MKEPKRIANRAAGFLAAAVCEAGEFFQIGAFGTLPKDGDAEKIISIQGFQLQIPIL